MIVVMVFQGKASLDITNLRGDTPGHMITFQIGSVWVSPKVVERVRELNQTTQRRNVFLRFPKDKVNWHFVLKMFAAPNNKIHFVYSVLDIGQW